MAALSFRRGYCAFFTVIFCYTLFGSDHSVSSAVTAGQNRSSASNQTGPDFCNDGCENNTKISSINKVNLSDLGLEQDTQEQSIGIDLKELGNLTEIEEVLSNDTAIGQLVNTSQVDDRRSMAASYILAILTKQKYDKNAAPLIMDSAAVRVKFGVHVISISNVDNQKMEFQVLVQLRMQWRDFRLKHTFEPYILIKEKNITDQIWRPDPYFVNEKDVDVFDVTFPNMRMAVFPDGLVTYAVRYKITPTCQMSFCRFPQDRQACDLKISSMAYPSDMVEFSWFDDAPVEMAPDIRMPDLQLMNHTWGRCLSKGNILNNSCLRVTFDLQRSAASHILRRFAPSFAALLFAWAGAYVPQHFQDMRIVTPITILLTLKQLQRSSDDTPTTSYLTSMDIWFSAVETFTILALIETMLVYGVSRRIKTYRKMAKYSMSEVARRNYEEKANNAERYSSLLDYSSRFLFPVLFAVFAILYATVIANGDQTSCL